MSFLREKLKFAFAEVYQPDGYDPNTMTLNKAKIEQIFLDQNAGFLLHPITLTAAFLGLPNQLAFKKPSWANIWYNFIGFEHVNWAPAGASTFRKLLNIPEALFISAAFSVVHTVIFALKLPMNILSTVTELLPALGKVLFKDLAERAEKSNSPIINRLGYCAATAAYVAFTGLHFIGRSVTSPVKGILSAYYEGRALTASLIGNDTGLKREIGQVVGVGLGVLSAFVTGLVYTVAFPAAVHLITTTVAPAIISHLPSVVTSTLAPVARYASQGLHWVDTTIIQKIGLGLQGTLHAIGIGISPALALSTGKLMSRLVETGFKAIFGTGVEKVKRISKERLVTPPTTLNSSHKSLNDSMNKISKALPRKQTLPSTPTIDDVRRQCVQNEHNLLKNKASQNTSNNASNKPSIFTLGANSRYYDDEDENNEQALKQ